MTEPERDPRTEAQREYDSDQELRELLTRAARSPTVRRARRAADRTAVDHGPMTEPEHHLTAADAEFLHRHSGVREATEEELASMAGRTAASAARELRHTRSLPKVAGLLGVSEREVLGLTAAGSLYSYSPAPGSPRWPVWQFAYGHPLPHLHEVVAAIPAGSHPSGVRTLMTSPSPDLITAVPLDHPVQPLIPRLRRSPSDWLSDGGSAVPVLALLAAFAGAI